MGFLDRMIKNGISRGVSNAIGKAVQQAVEPKATELANKAANSIDQAARSADQQYQQANATQGSYQSTGGLEGAFGNLQRSMENYATEAAKNMKVCPVCGKGATADKKFCPACGAKLPEQTLASDAVCTSCGKQNTIGTKFCADCGAKLPAAIQEEQAEAAKAAEVLAEWDTKLMAYPKWNGGGTGLGIDQYDDGSYRFWAQFSTYAAAQSAVAGYRILLQQSGFAPAGQYPSVEHLYKRDADGTVYHVDTEHCFDGDSECPTIGFDRQEPYGGFDYVKPEEKKKTGIFDLFK